MEPGRPDFQRPATPVKGTGGSRTLADYERILPRRSKSDAVLDEAYALLRAGKEILA